MYKNTKTFFFQYAWKHFVRLFFFFLSPQYQIFVAETPPIPLFVLDPLWYDFPDCTCYWDDERIREANKTFFVTKMCLSFNTS